MLDPHALPPPVRAAIDRLLHGRDLDALRRAAVRMSDNYRTARPSRTQVDTEADVLAYLAVRAPATYAAVRRVIEEARHSPARRLPRHHAGCGLRPRHRLVGSTGPLAEPTPSHHDRRQHQPARRGPTPRR